MPMTSSATSPTAETSTSVSTIVYISTRIGRKQHRRARLAEADQARGYNAAQRHRRRLALSGRRQNAAVADPRLCKKPGGREDRDEAEAVRQQPVAMAG